MVMSLLFFLLFVSSSFGLPRVGRHIGALNEGLRRYTSGLQAGDAPEQWYESQKVDHFNPLDLRTWRQRYFVNWTYWDKPKGPILVMIGGEGPISASYVNGHFNLNNFAKTLKAAVLGVEHRFYGSSQPFPDTSVANLRYLTSQQALADLAQFQQFFTEQYGVQGKWFYVGGSYPGSLSAWFRYKYPHLAVGSIASSGPVLAQLDFSRYLDDVAFSLGASCSQLLGNATSTLETLIVEQPAVVQKQFNTCAPIISDADRANFFESITDAFAGIVQYNNDNRGSQVLNITGACDIVSKATDPVKGWAQVLAQLSPGQCLDASYSSMITQLRDTSLTDTAARSWTWQTCTEFGFFQTAEGESPFSKRINLKFFLDICADVYGNGAAGLQPPYSPDTNFINNYYGQQEMQGTRVLFVEGSVDPWRSLTTLPPAPNRLLVSVYMQGTAHVADLYAPSPNDVPDLTKTRSLELSLMTQWLTTSL